MRNLDLNIGEECLMSNCICPPLPVNEYTFTIFVYRKKIKIANIPFQYFVAYVCFLQRVNNGESRTIDSYRYGVNIKNFPCLLRYDGYMSKS